MMPFPGFALCALRTSEYSRPAPLSEHYQASPKSSLPGCWGSRFGLCRSGNKGAAHLQGPPERCYASRRRIPVPFLMLRNAGWASIGQGRSTSAGIAPDTLGADPASSGLNGRSSV